MPLPSSVPLEFGRHDLAVFNQSRFSPWALPEAPTVSHNRLQVWHAGRWFTLKQRRPVSESVQSGHQSRTSSSVDMEELVHVLRDPVRRQNLLVIRKADAASGPLGYFNAYSVFPSGEEELVGYSKLGSHHLPSSASLSTAGVVRHAFRKPATLASEIARRKRMGDKDSVRALQKSADLFTQHPPEPGMRSVSYRRIGLGYLLIALAEEVAAKAGYRTLYTNAFKETAGFMLKHGWVALKNKDYSNWCVKHLRSPQGLRERLSAAWNRLWKAE